MGNIISFTSLFGKKTKAPISQSTFPSQPFYTAPLIQEPQYLINVEDAIPLDISLLDNQFMPIVTSTMTNITEVNAVNINKI